ncbi:MAG: NAD(P)-dependent oxidoreductase [Caldilineaceae bacterium]|nr:NAD(P)-dependent oxidoreductase [Caldilineaceae bacterium]
MKLLITGALGFVGINIMRTLAARAGVEIVAADLHPPDRAIRRFLAPLNQAIRFITLDVTDRAAVRNVITEFGITHIIHGAAATPSPQDEIAKTTQIVDVNLGGVINVLDASVASADVARLLVVSSSGVYGLTGQSGMGVLTEESPPALDSLYAVTKRSAELLAARYAALHGKRIASVRLGPIYGPGERTSAARPRMSAPGQLLEARRNDQPVTVWGADVIRDWTYAGDVGEGLYALLVAERWQYPVYNLSYGRPVSFGTMAETFQQQGVEILWAESAEAADVRMLPEQTRTPLSTARLLEDSGYRPQTSPEQGAALSCALDLKDSG